MTLSEFREHLATAFAAGTLFDICRSCILAHRRQHDDANLAWQVDECRHFAADHGVLGIYNAAWTSVTAELEDRAAVNAMKPSWERNDQS